MTDKERLGFLIGYMLDERRITAVMPEDEDELFRLYRSLVNTRPPAPVSEEFLSAEDEYLLSAAKSRGVTDISDIAVREPHIRLWRGDITTLRCGAIVNAANSGMTGCYSPCHGCIDNCIHTFAGVRLRSKCSEIMQAQGHEEPTGTAKITPAYDLPCEYVLHTVGPIVQGRLTEKHRELLESCYKSCLELAVKNGVESIAFCCISTGVFGYPQREAARTAVDTVRGFLKEHSIEVIFNVFTKDDLDIYDELLGTQNA